MDISTLIANIAQANQWFSGQAARQINTALTLRNWAIGMFIREYEQKGQDRAQYGDRLLKELAIKLAKNGAKGLGERNLYSFKEFHEAYPQILQTLSAKLKNTYDQSTSSLFPLLIQQVSTQSKAKSDLKLTNPDLLLDRITFSHFLELLKCDTLLKRTFYETETLANNWSVRTLRRAMDSMLFERTGLSKNKQSVFEKHQKGADLKPEDILRTPYVLEFLGLEEKPEYSENDLEQAIINHLQTYATGGLAQQIFVSKYLLNLPSEEELRQIVWEEQAKMSDR